MRSLAAAFAAGLLFAVGLALAGMTQPGKVAGFLDFFGDWDPSLAFVMVGAIAVHMALVRPVLLRPTPLLARTFESPGEAPVNLRLVVGAAIFGVGWGMSGYCPGPALVSLAVPTNNVLVFVAAMGVGVLASRALDSWRPAT